jgi:hypothetical protein
VNSSAKGEIAGFHPISSLGPLCHCSSVARRCVGGRDERMRRRAVSQFSDGGSGEKDLIAGEQFNLMLEVGTASPTERGAEHAGVDNESHDRSAEANASSSSIVRSSITRRSADGSTGAAASSSSVRSRSNNVLPCGTSR